MIRRALRLKIRRQSESALCEVCGTWTFLTPCSGERHPKQDPDGLPLYVGRAASRIASWLLNGDPA